MAEKKWSPELWRPIGIKEVDVSNVPEPVGKINSFLDYQALEDRYEVRGIMPKAPKCEKKEKDVEAIIQELQIEGYFDGVAQEVG